MSSGGYSNLGSRGKNFQKLMLSEKKNRSDLGLHIFLPKSRCSLKKKKKGLHFDFISDFPIFLPKSRRSLKKKKKVFTQNRPLNKHLQRIQNYICCFRGGALKIERGPQKKGGLRRLPHSPHPISTTGHVLPPKC